MATRRERVVLELEDRFTADIARAAAATALYRAELRQLDGTNVRTTRSGSALERQTASTTRTMAQGGSELDRFTGRAKLLANIAASISPAIAPIGAVAIPAVTGLASTLGFLTLGIGTSVFALHGLGDALKAMDAAAIDPTQAHLQKVEQTLGVLSPAARDFAHELHNLMPLIKTLQTNAGNGLFPGLDAAAADLEHVVPRLQFLMEIIGTASGRIAADAAASLASGKWDDFIHFLETEGPQALGDFAAAAGNTVHALAELWMATTPLNRDFSSWLVESTHDLDMWASHLSQTEGFHEFVAYIEENGPQVAHTFGAIGNAILQVIEASAPLGGPVLKVIETLADALAKVADSDLGTPIMTMVTALSALRLATSAQNAIAEKTWGSPMVGKVRGFGTALTTVTTAQQRATTSAEALAAAESKRAATVSKGFSTMGRGAGTLALLGLTATGAADDIGLANTASLAFAGSMAGPWGAAVGGAIGLVTDLRAMLRPSSDELDQYTQRLLTLAGPDIADQLGAVNDEIAKQKDLISNSTNYFQRLGGNLSFGIYNPVGDNEAKLDALTKTKKDLEAQTKAEAAAQEYANSVQGQAAARVRETIAAQQALIKSASDVSSKFIDISHNADNVKVSLTDFIRGLEIQAAALTQFGENAQKAAKRGLDEGLIKSLEDLGPAGALRMKQLANASDKEIARANNAFRKGQIAARAYAISIGAIPDPHINVVGAEAVKAKLAQIKAAMAGIHDKTIRLDYYVNQSNAAGRGRVDRADGGTVPGQRMPYGDKVLIHAAPGEEIITNRNGEADRFRADRASGRIPAYANGGTVRGTTPSTTGSRSHVLSEWNRALARSTEAINRERSKRDELVQAQSALVSAVAEKLRTDLFTSGSSSNLSVWLSDAERKKAVGGDVFGTLQNDIGNATAFQRALRQLKAKGLDGSAFANVAQGADLNQAQALAAMSASDVRRFEALFNRRQQLSQSVGHYAGQAAYGKEIASQTEHLRELVAGNRSIDSRLKTLEKYAKDNPSAVGKSVGQNVKGIGPKRP